LDILYAESGDQVDCWQRQGWGGAITTMRLRWILDRAGVQCRVAGPIIGAILRQVDDALVWVPRPFSTALAE
jgi:hypothetical protein